MEHVVFYPAQDGSPAFRRLENLEEAVRLVEHLRNVEGVGEASVHSLTEVPLSFRAYYRVEVPGLAGDVSAVTPVAENVPVDAPAPAEEPTSVEPQPTVVLVAPQSGHETIGADSDDSGAPSLDPDPEALPVLVPEQAEQHDTYELVAVGAPEAADPPPAPTGSPFSTDRSLGFFA